MYLPSRRGFIFQIFVVYFCGICFKYHFVIGACQKTPSVPHSWGFAPNRLIRVKREFMLVYMVYRSSFTTYNFTAQAHGKICKNNKSSIDACKQPPSVPPSRGLARNMLIRFKMGLLIWYKHLLLALKML